jgi:hypothetical protein
MPSKTVSAASWITIIGGLGLAIDSFARLPTAAAVASFVMFLGGAVAVAVLSAADAQRRGISIGRAMWQGVRQGLRWIWAFMP